MDDSHCTKCHKGVAHGDVPEAARAKPPGRSSGETILELRPGQGARSSPHWNRHPAEGSQHIPGASRKEDSLVFRQGLGKPEVVRQNWVYKTSVM